MFLPTITNAIMKYLMESDANAFPHFNKKVITHQLVLILANRFLKCAFRVALGCNQEHLHLSCLYFHKINF